MLMSLCVCLSSVSVCGCVDSALHSSTPLCLALSFAVADAVGVCVCVCACAVVPESIGNLTALTVLLLSNNQISGELLQREGCGEG